MRKTIGALGVLAALAAAPVASAHVTASPPSAPAEGYAKFDFNVGHGCEDSPTTKVTIRMPDQVQSATPQVVPGWTIATKEGKLPQPYDSHGEQVTEGVREVSWSGGKLDPHQLEQFGLSVKLAGKPGETIYFKTVQACEQGKTSWVEIPVEGGAEPESPAPQVELTAAEEDGHDTPVALDTTAAATPDEDSDSNGLAIAALVVGALGLLAGGAALVSARK